MLRSHRWFGTPVNLAMAQTHLAGMFKLLFRFKFVRKGTWLILLSHQKHIKPKYLLFHLFYYFFIFFLDFTLHLVIGQKKRDHHQNIQLTYIQYNK